MNYQLCKQLKDNGFPQIGDGYWSVPPCSGNKKRHLVREWNDCCPNEDK